MRQAKWLVPSILLIFALISPIVSKNYNVNAQENISHESTGNKDNLNFDVSSYKKYGYNDLGRLNDPWLIKAYNTVLQDLKPGYSKPTIYKKENELIITSANDTGSNVLYKFKKQGEAWEQVSNNS